MTARQPGEAAKVPRSAPETGRCGDETAQPTAAFLDLRSAQTRPRRDFVGQNKKEDGITMDTLQYTVRERDWPKSANVGEVGKALDQFYEDPANMQITVLHAIVPIKMRFEGRDPKNIEELILLARMPVNLCLEKWEPPSPEQMKEILEDIKNKKIKKKRKSDPAV
jgi:hypothetical protein